MVKSNFTDVNKVIDLLLDVVCIVDAGGRFVYVSAACERVFGYKPEEMIGSAMIEHVFPEDRSKTLQVVGNIMSGEPQPHFENRYLRKDGQVVHIMWSARWSDDDKVRIAVARDITERKRAETLQAALYAISEAAHAAEDMYALYKQIHQIIARLLPANNFCVVLYDENADELSFPYHVDEHELAPSSLPLDAGTLSAQVIRGGETLLLTPDNSPLLAQRTMAGKAPRYWLGVPLKSYKGTVGALAVQSYCDAIRYTETDRDLLLFVSAQIATAIERKQMQARLQYMAQYDPLTDMPNRILLHDRLNTALARARREKSGLALFYLDLDKFKQVNDEFGHAAGDLLLRRVAERLKHSVRATDTIARLSGDEFVVLLEKIQLPEHVTTVAEKLRSTLIQPFELDGRRVQILPSIGIALYPGHGDTDEELLRHADDAMYAAKRKGGNRFHLYLDGDS